MLGGGVSYLEWVQGLSYVFWDEQRVQPDLDGASLPSGHSRVEGAAGS